MILTDIWRRNGIVMTSSHCIDLNVMSLRPVVSIIFIFIFGKKMENADWFLMLRQHTAFYIF